MRVLYDSSMMNPCQDNKNNTLNTKVSDREVLLKLSGLRKSGWGTPQLFKDRRSTVHFLIRVRVFQRQTNHSRLLSSAHVNSKDTH